MGRGRRTGPADVYSGGFPAILRTTDIFSSRSSLVTFFRNPAFCGFPHWWLKHYGLRVPDCVEKDPVVAPYVSVTEWLLVQRGFKKRPAPRSTFSGWPLVGMGTCGYCGSAVIAHAYAHSRKCDLCAARWPQATPTCPGCGADYSRRAGFHRYLCGRHNRRADRCPHSRYVGGRKLELGLLHQLAPYFTRERMLEILDDVNAGLAAIHQASTKNWEPAQAHLRAAERAAANLLEAVKRGGPSSILIAEIQSTDREIARLKAELAMLAAPGPAPYIDPAETEALADFFQGQVFALRRHRLHQLFKGLGVSWTLWNDRAEATFDWPPLQMLVPLHDCLYPQRGTFTFLQGWGLFSAALRATARSAITTCDYSAQG